MGELVTLIFSAASRSSRWAALLEHGVEVALLDRSPLAEKGMYD
jgi:hypothetical protein